MKRRRYTTTIILAAVALAVGVAPLAAQQAPTRAAREAEALARLKSNAAIYDKTRACQQLALVGSARAVPVLAGLLGHERLGDYARIALEPIESPDVDEAFRKAIGTLKGRQLAGVVNSIGVRRDVKAVGALTRLVADPGRGAASQALAALGRIASDEALKPIERVLATGPPELLAAAGDAALAAAERLRGQKKTAAAVALYAAIGKAPVARHIKAAAAYHAIVARGPAGAPQLVAHLRGKDAAMRRVALRAARAMGGAEVAAALAAELPKSPPPVQVALIELLAERGGPGVQKPIVQAATGDNAAVRAAAIAALGKIGDAAAVGVLAKAHACGAKAEQHVATASLRVIRGKGVDEAIVKVMSQAQDTQCVALMEIIVARQYRPASKALLGKLRNSTMVADVSIAAFKALGALAGPADLPGIIKALDEKYDASVTPHAEKAIALVARRIADPGARADAVLAALAKAKKTPIRCSLLGALGGIGGAKAHQAVAKAAGDDDPRIRDSAIRALAVWPDAQAAPTLLKLVKTTDNKTHRVLALRGYVRLLALDAGRDPQAAVRKYAEAMALAQRPDAKKLVLSGLAGVPHSDALMVVLPCLDDAAIRDEAALAAVSIAQATMGADRTQARAAMVKLLAASRGKPIAAQARRIIRQIDAFADAITAWRVAGPYMKAGLKYDRLFDVRFAPETPAAKGVTWRALPAGTDPKRPRILDLRKAIGGDQRVAYVLTWVHSAAAQPARLELGSDDGVKAWLNGKLVHANNVARAAIPYTDKAPVTLKAGWNPLLLKITQNQIPWEFCARICRPDGKPLTGIRIDPAHQGPWMVAGSP